MATFSGIIELDGKPIGPGSLTVNESGIMRGWTASCVNVAGVQLPLATGPNDPPHKLRFVESGRGVRVLTGDAFVRRRVTNSSGRETLDLQGTGALDGYQ